jgi:hypothetical protein
MDLFILIIIIMLSFFFWFYHRIKLKKKIANFLLLLGIISTLLFMWLLYSKISNVIREKKEVKKVEIYQEIKSNDIPIYKI